MLFSNIILRQKMTAEEILSFLSWKCYFFPLLPQIDKNGIFILNFISCELFNMSSSTTIALVWGHWMEMEYEIYVLELYRN